MVTGALAGPRAIMGLIVMGSPSDCAEHAVAQSARASRVSRSVRGVTPGNLAGCVFGIRLGGAAFFE
jgi:hypothetical protein